MRHLFASLLLLSLPVAAHAETAAEAPCTRLSGIVKDSTDALIPGASLSLDGKTTRTSGADGRFSFPCVTEGKHELTATMADFATFTLRFAAPHANDVTFHLTPATETNVTVTADEADLEPEAPGGGNGLTVSGSQLKALADDPDDLLRQLQQLAAAAGGSPANTVISVDGFQDSSKLPPKDSIAYIQVTPDLFSAEYREPPFGGGRVEVFTKPGASTFHGGLLATNSSSWMNAADPFSTNQGKIGKQRYGFDFSGPVRKKGSSFTLSLEHRSIDEVSVVNAVDANNRPIIDNVAQPKSLWVAQARIDWQLTPKNFAFATYSANANSTENVGVGGSTLREAGYADSTLDQTIRAADVYTISPKLMHEVRAQLEWYTDNATPNSLAPSVQVSGYFTGGGSALGATRQYRQSLEVDEDIVATPPNHSIKAGYQFFWKRRDSLLRNGFNGVYTYSSNTAYLTNTPQQLAIVTGNPEVFTDQQTFAAFFQDTMKLKDQLSFSFGARYLYQQGPGSYNAIAPRLGLAWSPDKKKLWQFKTHFGIFNDQYGMDSAEEINREDGNARVTSLYMIPRGATTLSNTPIHSLRTLGPNSNPGVYVLGDFNISRDLPHGFNINVEEVLGRFLTYDRTLNINQPTNGDPYGPRPFAANTNILQVTNNGTGQGHGEFFGLSNFRLKRAGFFIGALHLNLRDNTDDKATFQPESSTTDAGEQANRDNQPTWMVFTNANFKLPYSITLGINGMAGGDQPFNLTTGQDNNGDGTFNDRPQLAAPGTVADNVTTFNTPWGVLTNTGPIVNGSPLRPTQRNLGRLPWNFHLDANLERAFVLTHDKKAAHQQTIAVNIRSANFLNHTNVTSEGSIPGTPQFLKPVATDSARRVEFGVHYTF